MLTTTNYSLNKPEDGEAAATWTAALNTNADTIDTLFLACPAVIYGTTPIGHHVGIGSTTLLTPVVY